MEKKRLTVRLDPEIHNELKKLKKKCFPDLPMNSIIKIAIQNFISEVYAHNCALIIKPIKRRKRNAKRGKDDDNIRGA